MKKKQKTAGKKNNNTLSIACGLTGRFTVL